MGERLFLLLLACASAGADEPKAKSFETALESAEPVGDLADRFDPLFAECKRADDLETRQCTAVRDLMLERLKEATIVFGKAQIEFPAPAQNWPRGGQGGPGRRA